MKGKWMIKDKKYTVYVHICPDETRYFGCTCQVPKKRWAKNGNGYKYRRQLFYNAIQKFGWENIRHEIISVGLSKEEGYALEQKLIAEYKTTDKMYGWNIGAGGYGNPLAGKTKEEMLEIIKSRSGENHPMYGKHLAEETKIKMSENHADFSKENHPSWGSKRSEETKRKISENHKCFCGENHPQYIQRTPEMYADVKNGIRRKDFIEKYGVGRKIWESIKNILNNT